MDVIRIGVLAVVSLVLAGCGDKGPWDGPFGTKKGLTQEQVEQFAVLTVAGESGAITTLQSPQAPTMAAKADEYTYAFGEALGLCQVAAFFNNPRVSPLAENLRTKYGVPQKDPESKWGVIWTGATHKLDNDIQEIRMSFFGSEPSVSAVVKVTYLSNSECK